MDSLTDPVCEAHTAYQALCDLECESSACGFASTMQRSPAPRIREPIAYRNSPAGWLWRRTLAHDSVVHRYNEGRFETVPTARSCPRTRFLFREKETDACASRFRSAHTRASA